MGNEIKVQLFCATRIASHRMPKRRTNKHEPVAGPGICHSTQTGSGEIATLLERRQEIMPDPLKLK